MGIIMRAAYEWRRKKGRESGGIMGMIGAAESETEPGQRAPLYVGRRSAEITPCCALHLAPQTACGMEAAQMRLVPYQTRSHRIHCPTSIAMYAYSHAHTAAPHLIF